MENNSNKYASKEIQFQGQTWKYNYDDEYLFIINGEDKNENFIIDQKWNKSDKMGQGHIRAAIKKYLREG